MGVPLGRVKTGSGPERTASSASGVLRWAYEETELGMDEAGDKCSVSAASQQSSQNHSSSRSVTVLMPTHGR